VAQAKNNEETYLVRQVGGKVMIGVSFNVSATLAVMPPNIHKLY
jgi:hypothetical protein